MRRSRRAQSTLEYAVIIMVIVVALIALQIYMKRGVEGKLRDGTDQVGQQFDIDKTAIVLTTTRAGTTTMEENPALGKGATKTTYTGVSQKTVGTEKVDVW